MIEALVGLLGAGIVSGVMLYIGISFYRMPSGAEAARKKVILRKKNRRQFRLIRGGRS